MLRLRSSYFETNVCFLKHVSLFFHISGINIRDLTANVTSPSGVSQRCDVLAMDDVNYTIKFVPQEMGVHTVSVRHRGSHISGK